MTNDNNSYQLRRRNAFYSNTLYSLQQLILSVKECNADKWVTDFDKNAMDTILAHLSSAELALILRYQDVLRGRADELGGILREAKHD